MATERLMIERAAKWKGARPWRSLAIGAVLACSLVAGPSAFADDEKSGVLTVYAVTAGATALGTESVRIVQSDTGAFFASGEIKLKRGKTRTHLISHLQREADGELTRYRRVESGRRGKGVFLFKHNDGTRAVGVNTDAKQADFQGISKSHPWDPKTWHHLAVVAKRLTGEGPVKVPFFDVETRRSGTATFTRTGTTQLKDADGADVVGVIWAPSGGPGGVRDLVVSAKGRLLGVRAEGRAMLVKGWVWDDGTRADADDDDEAGKSAAARADDDEHGGDDDGAGSDAGVGP